MHGKSWRCQERYAVRREGRATLRSMCVVAGGLHRLRLWLSVHAYDEEAEEEASTTFILAKGLVPC